MAEEHGSSVGPRGGREDEERADTAPEPETAASEAPAAADETRTEHVTETTETVVTEPADKAVDDAVADAVEKLQPDEDK